ncbi:hypothetical protein [Candidatus Accumulibacter contiguus]|uniref:hypothetical protein n=1 Tax=Candidatus Accumulibacter contiguus TaxID=2954381 RepID=UPI001B7E88F9|nr:hypothetical protein [Candidatus Accumulibacter contiguus]
MSQVFFDTGAGNTGLKLFVEIGEQPFQGGIKLFEDLTFGAGHSSGSFSADAASDPDFLNFTAKLTDGVNDYFSFMHRFVPGPCCGGGEAQREFQLFGVGGSKFF